VKEKPRGCWTKDNTWLNLNNIQRITKVVEKEIKYVSSLYPFRIDRYFNSELVYAKSIFFFVKGNRGLQNKMSRGDLGMLRGLATGIELLGIGLSLHIFDSGKSKDNEYVLELLIGDIIYARAIIYLLQHGDFDLFRTILSSLKKAHENRLIIHRKIEEGQRNEFYSPGSIKKIIDDRGLMIEAGSLLKTSFEISRQISGGTKYNGSKDDDCIDSMVKTLAESMAIEGSVGELKSYLLSLQKEGRPIGQEVIDVIRRKHEKIRSDLFSKRMELEALTNS